ncbi:MAG: selenocysteine-specific translation elongation factor [Desulfobulbaceae bacterium A2]|nr:MAG: selenocysteine-specific translation elongation factor [Desulfobulbaceae bacterium A2]
MREFILGTAGHVDHGKTSLVRALTGIDTDRLKEEKERGITIELGFAHLDLPCGHRLGIIDVPGHEKFVKNMVAGAAGMDLVAFVIAADEGIMPQTREHMEICQLLGVRDGLVVLTKIDMVEPDWLELVQDEVREFCAGTFLAEAPILPVSSVSGAGIEELHQALNAKVAAMPAAEAQGPFRLAVDRVFTMKGFGAVITGTALSGRLRLGEELMLYPRTVKGKVRTIQVHGQEQAEVEAGRRTAINLQGLELDEIRRGDMAATPGALASTVRLDCELNLLSSWGRELKHRAPVRLHLGTAEILARVLLLDEAESISAGTNGTLVQLVLQELVTAWPGDHFVLRSYSPVTTIGGGIILHNQPRKRKRAKEEDRRSSKTLLDILRRGTMEEKLLALVEESGIAGLTQEELAVRLGLFGNRLKKLIDPPLSRSLLLLVDQRYLAPTVVNTLQDGLCRMLTAYHQAHPLKTGIAKEELRSQFQPELDVRLFQYCLAGLTRQGRIVQEQAELHLSSHQVTLQADEAELKTGIRRIYQEAGLTPLNLPDLGPRLGGVPEGRLKEVLSLLLQEGELIKVNEALIFHAAALTALQQRLEEYLRQHGEIDAPGFKELSGLTRKYSIPLLEYFDKIRLTIRVGDKRQLRKG